MLKFGIKSVVFGTAVYYSMEKGVWKDSATTTALFEDLEKGVSPYVGEFKSKVPYELPPLPTNDRISYLFKYYWNSGVKSVFRFIVDLPTHATDAASSVYKLASDALQAAEPRTETKEVGK